jgi:hypothetical protein
MNTSSRTAPVIASFASWTMLLNCLPRRVVRENWPSGMAVFSGSMAKKWALPSGVPKFQSAQRWAPPYWNWSPFFLQVLDAFVEGNDPGDLVADGRRVQKLKPLGEFGLDAPGQIEEYLPLGARLADAATGNLGTEDDAALGAGLGDTAGHFVARGGGQEQGVLAGVDEHLGRKDDVHVDPQGYFGQGPASTKGGSGSTSRKLPPNGKEHVEPRCGPPLRSSGSRPCRGLGHGEAPLRREARGVLRIDGQSAGEGGGVGPHLRAALHAGVSANGHEPATLGGPRSPWLGRG